MFQEFPENNKNDDFLDEFRQKLADQSAASLEEKRQEINHSKNVFIGAFSGLALAGIVGWFVLSPQYKDNTPTEIPVIKRPQTAVKVQPSEPGGMEIQNQDKSVYGIIEKKPTDNNILVENLLPPPETPQVPVVQTPAQEDTAVPTPVAEETAENIEELTQKAQAIIEEVNKENTQNNVENKETAPKPQKEETTVAEKTEAPAVNIPKKEEVKVIIKETPSVATKGNWQLQLMSSPNKEAIEKSWKTLAKKYSILQDLPHEIESADLGARGTFYRLKAGNFTTQKEASSLCSEIKSLGGSCIVKKK